MKKRKTTLISIYTVIFFIAVALLAPFIANEKPLYVSYKNHSLFPAFSIKNRAVIETRMGNETKKEALQFDQIDWKKFKCDKIIFAPVPYSPSTYDYLNADYSAPGDPQFYLTENGKHIPIPSRFTHWLGTDKLGRDVLSGLIHGTRISLAIGILSMSIAAFIGIFLGAVGGYFGDTGLKTTRGIFWMMVIGIFVAFFYAFQLRTLALTDSLRESTISFLLHILLSILIFFLVLLCFYFIGKLLNSVSFFRKHVYIKADSIISRFIEILISLPALILILSIAAIARPSFVNLIIIIGLTSWTDIARLTRAEFLRLRNIEFIEAVRALGYSRRRIIFRHALPNAIAPATVAIAFGISTAILVESSLSFLGIGVPQDVVTWGSMLAQGRENFNAWWLVVFPGIALFITVTVFNLIGDREIFMRRTK